MQQGSQSVMKKIERDGNWCSVDKLDGVELKHNEDLIVEWPDGELQVYKIKVVRGTIECGEQGGTYHGPQSHAFVMITHKGHVVDVPIVGLRAQRVSLD